MKKIVSTICILIFILCFSVVAYADPLSLGIGSAFAGASGVDLTIGGMSAAAGSSWYNSSTGATVNDISIAGQADVEGNVPKIRITKNQDNSATVEIDSDSSIFQIFNGVDGYTYDLFDNNNITSNSSGSIYQASVMDGWVNGSIVNFGSVPYEVGSFDLGTHNGLHIYGNATQLQLNNQVKGTMYWEYKGSTSSVLYNTSIDIGKYYVVPRMENGYYYLDLWNVNVSYKITSKGQYTPSSYGSETVSYTSGTIDSGSGYDYIHIGIEDSYLSDLSSYLPADWQAGDTVAVDSVSFWETILEIISDIAINGDVDSEYTDIPVPPIPPEPTPIPTDALGDVPYDDWMDTFGQHVLDGQEDVVDAIDTAGQSVTDALDDQTDVIDTWGQSVVSWLQTIYYEIVDGVESILEDILELLQELVESIETSLLDLFSAGVTGFGNAFSGALSDIADSFGIWHYVVEWLSSISSIFSTFFNIMSSTSYYLVLPIYASVAGTLCIAFYKRFGK